MFRVIIAGSRDFNDYELLKKTCDDILSSVPDDVEVVSGGARGADKLGERFAKEYKLPLKVFPADWDKHGKSAGYKRNQAMAYYASYGDLKGLLVCFWDGESNGTRHMIDMANNYGLHVKCIHYNDKQYKLEI